MPVHLHRARQWTGWFLTATALSPFALIFAPSETREFELAPVTGRLTIGGRPAGDMILCLDNGSDHTAFSPISRDGSFCVSSMRWSVEGIEPGHYVGHLHTFEGGPRIPEKYVDTRTSGIVIRVAADWNDFRIDLP